MKIAIAGTGYVGLSMSILLSQHNDVVAVDIVPEKVENYNIMAENGSVQNVTALPVSEYHFSVEISGIGKISCKEVSGLDIEFDAIEYRSGDMPGFTKIKMPGLRKSGDVTIKKAVFKDDKGLMDWLDTVKKNTVKRTDATVKLLDEEGFPVQSWKLTNAWPKKYTAGGSRTGDTGISMETIVLAHEGVTPV